MASHPWYAMTVREYCIFGGGTNGFSKYERGETAQSVAMDRLLRLVIADPSKLDELRAMAGMSRRRE